MAELSELSHLSRGQITRDQWYAEVLRLAEVDTDDPEAVAVFAGADPRNPARIRGGSEYSLLAPSPLWDECYKAELSPVAALEGAAAAVELDEAERASAPADDPEPEDEEAADPAQAADRDHPSEADDAPDAFGGQVFGADGPEDESRSEDPHPDDPFTPSDESEVVEGVTVARDREDLS